MGERVYFLLCCFVVLLIIMSIIFLSLLIFSSQRKSINSSKGILNNSQIDFKSKISDCLVNKELTSQCRYVFSEPGTEKICKNLDNKDRCFYNLAVVNLREDFCDNISEIFLKKECISESKRLLEFRYIGGKE